MRIIKIMSCWTCPQKKSKDMYQEMYWCSEAQRMFNLQKSSEEDVPEWCPLEES